jgi:hypothetical protein
MTTTTASTKIIRTITKTEDGDDQQRVDRHHGHKAWVAAATTAKTNDSEHKDYHGKSLTRVRKSENSSGSASL